MLDAVTDRVLGWVLSFNDGLQSLVALASAHPVVSFEIAAAASVLLLTRDTPAT